MAVAISTSGLSAMSPGMRLEKALRTLTDTVPARVGVAVIMPGLEGTELFAGVNADESFPMLSVYKFPQALAVADFCRTNGISINDSTDISPEELAENTYSPMRDRYGRRPMRLSIAELLRWSVQTSDNNACDILFRATGSPHRADSLMKTIPGCSDIHIRHTEAEMHDSLQLCRVNTSTPRAMARLLLRFMSEKDSSPELSYVAELMETCSTGTDRLAAPLGDKGIILGHKTGTSDRDPSTGLIIGINDAGYVMLPDGRRYAIAVFVSDSALGPEETARIISDVSQTVFNHISHESF